MKPPYYNYQEQIINDLIKKDREKLDSLIIECLKDHGIPTENIIELEPIVKERCHVEIKESVSRLFLDHKAICQWFYIDEPMKMIHSPFKIEIGTTLHFERL